MREENAYKILVGKPEEKRPYGITRSTWEVILKRIWNNRV
jgi:hypothetical protein